MTNKTDGFTVYMNVSNLKDFDAYYGFDVIDYALKLVSNYSKGIDWVWNFECMNNYNLKWLIKVQEIFYKYFDNASIKQVLNISNTDNCGNFKELGSRFGIDTNFNISGSLDVVKESINNIFDKDDLLKGKITINLDDNNDNSWLNIYNLLRDNKANNIEFVYNELFFDKKTRLIDKSCSDLSKNYKKVYSFWSKDPKAPLKENGFIDFIDSILLKRARLCDGDCRKNIISINLKGNVNPCYLIKNGAYSVENIFEFKRLTDIFETSKYKRYSFETQKRILTECKSCNYYPICNGGCNAFFASKNSGISSCDKSYCENFKSKITAMYEVFRDFDIYNSSESNYAITTGLLTRNIITISEIKNFLKDKGIDTKWEYSKDNFLNSKEYKLFKLFNLTSDFNIVEDDRILTKTVVGDYMKKNRYEIMSKIFDTFYIDIVKILE